MQRNNCLPSENEITSLIFHINILEFSKITVCCSSCRFLDGFLLLTDSIEGSNLALFRFCSDDVCDVAVEAVES